MMEKVNLIRGLFKPRGGRKRRGKKGLWRTAVSMGVKWEDMGESTRTVRSQEKCGGDYLVTSQLLLMPYNL